MGGGCRFFSNTGGQRQEGFLGPGGRIYLPRDCNYSFTDVPSDAPARLILLELAH
jgi:hypothetical protein